MQRQIVGELLTRFERKGFKIVGMKLTHATKELVSKHYTDDPDYLRSIGEKGIASALARGEEILDKDPMKIGAQVRNWNIQYLACGPVIAMVLQAPTVVDSVRKMLGSTNPANADVGTIRADYSPDSFLLANMQGRTTRTLLHASDSPENANREIALWFNEDELHNYETAMEKVLFDTGWSNN